MRREELRLQDIIESITAIESFLQNVEKENFEENELLQAAVIYKLIIIGEAATQISRKMKSNYPQVPWKKIVGLRNLAAHVYFSLDMEAIWSTATTRLKPLHDQISEILQNEFPDFKPEEDD
jgi:uncharacterized protein with HEPN domain